MANTEASVRPSFGNSVQPSDIGSGQSDPGGASTMQDIFPGGSSPKPLQAPPQQAQPAQAPAQIAQPQAEPAPRIPSSDDDALKAAFLAKASQLPKDQKKALDNLEDEELKNHFLNAASKVKPGEMPKFSNKTSPIDPNSPNGVFGQELKLTFANNRANLAQSLDKKKEVYSDAYGADNVQVRDGQVYIRPSGEGRFVKPTIQHDSIFMKAAQWGADRVSEIPGLVANVGATGTALAASAAGDVASGGVGLAATAPELAAAGALGGAAQFGTNKLVEKGLDVLSNGAQQVHESYNDLAAQGLKEMGINAVGMVTGGKIGNAVAGAVQRSGIKDLTQAIADKSEELLPRLTSFISNIQGVSRSVETSGRQIEGQVGQQTAAAIDGITDKLTKTLEMTKGKAIQLSEQSGQKVDASNLFQQFEKVFDQYGVKIIGPSDSAGVSPAKSGFAELPEDLSGRMPFASPNGSSVLKSMVDDYNYLKGMAVSNDGQIPPQAFYNRIKTYANLAQYDKTEGAFPEIQAAYKQLNGASIQDRIGFEGSIFKDTGLPEEKIVNEAYAKYAANASNIGNLGKLMKDDASRAMLVNSIATQPPATQLRTMMSLKNVLGADSPEWNMVRGETFNNMIQKASNPKTGLLDPSALIKTIQKMPPQVLETMFSKSEVGQIRQFSASANLIAAAQDTLEPAESVAADKAVKLVTSLFKTPTQAALSLLKWSNGNKPAIDHVVNNSLIEAARTAGNKTDQTMALDTMRYLEDFIGHSKVGIVKRAMGDGTARQIQTYLPYVGVGASSAVNNIFPNMKPQPIAPDIAAQPR